MTSEDPFQRRQENFQRYGELTASNLALAAEEQAGPLVRAMEGHYYGPSGLELRCLVARPSRGACLL